MREKIIKRKVSDSIPPADAYTVVYETNHIAELTVMEKYTQKILNYRRISKTEYRDLSTGEIKQYKQNKESSKNINKSLTKLKRLINNNFVGNDNELHITLTYSTPTFDKEKVSTDFKKFWKKLKYRYSNMEYICVYERHMSDVWHIHCLVQDKTIKHLFIPYEEIKLLWQQGNIKVSKTKNNDNIGAYFCKYSKNSTSDSEIYPKNSRLYSCSRGIKQPEKIVTEYCNTEQYTKDKKLFFHNTFDIVITDGVSQRNINRIHYLQYNAKIK